MKFETQLAISKSQDLLKSEGISAPSAISVCKQSMSESQEFAKLEQKAVTIIKKCSVPFISTSTLQAVSPSDQPVRQFCGLCRNNDHFENTEFLSQ